MKPRLLVLCARLPYPLDRGDKLRMYFQLRELRKVFEVYCIALSLQEVVRDDIAKVDEVVDHLKVIHISKSSQVNSIFKTFFSSLPFSVGLHYSAKAKKEIDQILHSFKPDHIYCQLTRMAEYVRSLDHQSKTIDYMDAFGEGMSRRGSVSTFAVRHIYNLEARRMSRYEGDIYNSFSNRLVISDQDAKLIDSSKRFEVIGNGIDCSYFKPENNPSNFDIGFVGNMGYLPNVAGAEYLVKEVLPLCGNLTVLIAGARPHQRVKQLASDRVTITGWVDDIRDAYNDCKIFVAPLWSGTGQQNKILEAMAMGIPVVTTSMVNQAIGAKPDFEILIADNAVEFQKQINKLTTNSSLRDVISANALEFVRKSFSWEEKGRKLIEIISNGI